jgi:hypothetical protein
MQDGVGAGNGKRRRLNVEGGIFGKLEEEEWKRRSGSGEFWRRLIVLVNSENV